MSAKRVTPDSFMQLVLNAFALDGLLESAEKALEGMTDEHDRSNQQRWIDAIKAELAKRANRCAI